MSASVFVALGVLAACGGTVTGAGGDGGGGGTITTSGYDQSCSQASDCTAVFQGTIGCCGECANTAINTKDLARYESALAAGRPTDCTETACPALLCIDRSVACVAGKCALGGLDAGSDARDDHAAAIPCGVTTCSGGDVCVMDQFEGGAERLPNDAGMCPDGEVKTGVACSPAPTYHCAPEPASCSGSLSCACAHTLCETGYHCMSAKDGLVGCYLLAP